MKSGKIFFKGRKHFKSIPKNKQEEQLFINPNRKSLLKKKSKQTNLICKYIYFSLFSLLTIILTFLFIKRINYSIKIKNNTTYYNNIKINNSIYIDNNYQKVYNTNGKSDPNYSKFKNMLPRLSPDFNTEPSSIEEIFNAREIYISDAKINSEYIRYIRPINETEEEKYNKRLSKHDSIIDKKIFEKRPDQFDYREFCKIALDEKLIDDSKIKYDNKPIISVIVPSYNKKNILIKSIRSIQNQNFKNIEIIIVNDCSTDNSIEVFNYLLKSDPRIRIFHHIKNMGCWRTRIDGIIYSRGKYVILFDAGDLYNDNYVLLDAFNVIEKYNLDSCKFLFRLIRDFNNLNKSSIYFHIGLKPRIAYEPKNIEYENFKVFYNWGNIWNRLVRANIFTKAFLLLNDLMLNLYKNVWDDIWFNKIVRRASFSYVIFERIGYVYYQDGKGEGSPQSNTKEEKNKIIKEYVGYLYYDYNFCEKNSSKSYIIDKLRDYNEINPKFRLNNFESHFEVLNDLLKALINDPWVNTENRTYCQKLLNESIEREKNLTKNKF